MGFDFTRIAPTTTAGRGRPWLAMRASIRHAQESGHHPQRPRALELVEAAAAWPPTSGSGSAWSGARSRQRARPFPPFQTGTARPRPWSAAPQARGWICSLGPDHGLCPDGRPVDW